MARKKGILGMHEVVAMRMKFETKGKKQVNIHYMNVPQPNVVEENFGGDFHDDDFALALVLQNQEFERDVHLDLARDSPSSGSRPKRTHSESRGERNSSRNARYDSQLALDEAFARELQDLENQLSDSTLGEHSRSETNANRRKSSTVNPENSSAGTSLQVAREDDIDPDNMSYEELQQLGEAIGTESKGLPDELISFLQSSTFRTGLFSRKGKQDQCVICCMAYKNRDKLIILPCQHQYHEGCITKWLKINKACPVCNEEVFGS